MQQKKFELFITKHSVTSQESHTHNISNKLYYVSNNELEDFNDLYSEIPKQNKSKTIEKRLPKCGPIAIDFRFELSQKNKHRQINHTAIENIINLLLEILMGMFGENEYTYVILQQPKYSTRDGFRIQFPYVICDYSYQEIIKQQFIKKYELDIKCDNNMNEIYDYLSDWDMYASTSYKMIKMGNSCGDIEFEHKTINERVTMLSLLNKFDIKPIYPINLPNMSQIYSKDDIESLLKLLSPSRKNNDWLNIGSILYQCSITDTLNNINYLNLWIEWSMFDHEKHDKKSKISKENKCKTQWGNFNSKTLGFIDLRKYAKLDNKHGYAIFKQTCLLARIDQMSTDQRDMMVADFFVSITKKIIKVSKNNGTCIIHKLDSNLLYKQIGLATLADEIKNDIMPYAKMLESIRYEKLTQIMTQHNGNVDKCTKKKIKQKNIDIVEFIGKMNNIAFINKIVRAVCLHHKIYEENFVGKLDANKSVINFLNGKVCLKTGDFEQRTVDDKYSRHINIEYVDKSYDATKINDDILDLCNNDEFIFKECMELLAYRLSGNTDIFAIRWKKLHISQENKLTLSEMCDLHEINTSKKHKLEIFNVLLPYSIDYYEHGFTINDINECISDQTIRNFLNECYVQTDRYNDRVYKGDLTKKFHQYVGNDTLKWSQLLRRIKGLHLGYVYDAHSSCAGHKSPNGCFKFLKEKPSEQTNQNIND